MKPIFLIGYMGSGKTTLARALCARTGLEFIDLDYYIENRFRQSVREMFATVGESEFRRRESAMLREVGEFDNVVVACGGGTPCFSGNIDYMNSRGTTVLLRASEWRLHERLAKGRRKRPLIAALDDDALAAMIGRGLAEREPFYSRAAIEFPSDELDDAAQIARSVGRFISMLGLDEAAGTHNQPTQ